jgi:transmembrane sensor
MTQSSAHQPDARQLTEAAEWLARLNAAAAGEAVWLEFTGWLEAGEANRVAFDLVEDLYDDLDDVELVASPDLDSNGWEHIPRPVAAGGLFLLAASLILGVGLEMRQSAPRIAHYETRIGETRTVALADGSTVAMNTDSAIDVSIGDERRVALVRGEAVFKVAHDPAHPFLVSAGNRIVYDVGTVFDLLYTPDRTVITVAEGRVGVAPLDILPQPQLTPVAAGEQLVARPALVDQVRKVDPATAMAWQQGYLTYRNTPLSIVVGDLNRYFPKKIVLMDQDAGRREFSGALKVDDEDAVVSRLAELMPLVVEHGNDGVITLRLKPQAD